MVTFEGCARRMGQIGPFLEKIGLGDLEEAHRDRVCLRTVASAVVRLDDGQHDPVVWDVALGHLLHREVQHLQGFLLAAFVVEGFGQGG